MMKPKIGQLISLVLLSHLFIIPPVVAVEDPPLGGFGMAVVDGILQHDEWENASHKIHQLRIPIEEGGGMIAVDMYVMNDVRQVYIGLKFHRPLNLNYSTEFYFIPGVEGAPLTGNDGTAAGVYLRNGEEWTEYIDAFLDSCYEPGNPMGRCYWFDSDPKPTLLPRGTLEGTAFSTHDAESTTIELSHPFNSSDDLHDLNAKLGETVRFYYSMATSSQKSICIPGPKTNFSKCFANTAFQGTLHITDLPGDITRDGAIDLQDLRHILWMMLGIRSPSEADVAICDTRPRPGTNGRPYGDGKIGPDDLNWAIRGFFSLEMVP